MSLWSDFLDAPNVRVRIDKPAHKWDQYFAVYQRHIKPNQPIVLWEIGVDEGGSVQLWQRYLGPRAQVVGLDIDPECEAHQRPGVAIRIGNQASTAFLDSVLAEFGVPDVVIDDGSHITTDILTTLSHVYPQMPRSGVYIIEDAHAFFWPESSGGVQSQWIVDELLPVARQLNAQLSRDQITVDEVSRLTFGISFYESMIVLERGPAVLRGAF